MTGGKWVSGVVVVVGMVLVVVGWVQWWWDGEEDDFVMRSFATIRITPLLCA